MKHGNRRLVVSTSCLAMVAFLASCGEPGGYDPETSRDNISNTLRDDGYRVNASLARFGDRDAVRAGGSQVSSGIFVGAKAERRAATALLPSQFEGPNAVTLISKEPMNITEIAGRLSEVTGLHHVVSLGPTGISQMSSTAESKSGDGKSESGDGKSENGDKSAASNSNFVGSSGGGEDSLATLKKKTTVQLRGPLSRVLDEIASAFDVEWEYSNGKVIFHDYVTRQYQLAALPSNTTGTTGIGSSGSAAGSTMSVSTTSTVDVWKDVRDAIKGLIGPGGNISLSPSTGMITVSAKAGDQKRVESYISDLNKTTGHQISFDVNILTVTLTGERNHGISLDSIFNSGGIEGSSEVSASGTDGTINIGIVNGNFKLGAVVTALEKYGKVSVATRAGATTSNNKVTPINATDITTYISGMDYSSSAENTTSVGTPNVEEIETGFQMQLLPRVMNNREIMVNYAIRLSELTAMEEVEYTGGTQQLPRISETAMEQQAVLRNGQTLVLSGFERDRTEIADSGYSLKVAGLGGAKTQKKNRVSTVLLITPRIIDRQDLARR